MVKETITRKKIQKRNYWKRHIEQWGKSGSTQAEYCRRHRLSTKSFTYWKRSLSDSSILNSVSGQKTPMTFVPVRMQPETQIAGDISSELVLCKDGYRIEIKEGFNPALLGEVLRALQVV